MAQIECLGVSHSINKSHDFTLKNTKPVLQLDPSHSIDGNNIKTGLPFSIQEVIELYNSVI